MSQNSMTSFMDDPILNVEDKQVNVFTTVVYLQGINVFGHGYCPASLPVYYVYISSCSYDQDCLW